jgi:LmbE family N-acetylglucosaminyl deacetylase
MLRSLIGVLLAAVAVAGEASAAPQPPPIPARPAGPSAPLVPSGTTALATPFGRRCLQPGCAGRVRALIISPHPDDATLGAGGLIQRVIHDGGTVRVVQMTGGDGFPKGVTAIRPRIRHTAPSYRWYGSLREREAIAAMRRLGVHRSQVRLLGFPDEGLCVLASPDRASTAFQSPYTRRDSPPESEQIVRGTMYRGDDLVRELTHLIEAFRPTIVVMPHPADDHPDHCATHLLVHRALTEASDAGLRPPRVLHYVIHLPGWPAVDRAGAPLEPPSSMLGDEWSWRTLTLTPAERTAKALALGAYRSQLLVMGDFLTGFERPNELFIQGEPSRPIPCWCSNGENIAAPSSGIR